MTAITLEAIQARQDELDAMIAAFNAAKTTITVPAATIELRPGEHYAGLVLNDDGTPCHHLVLMAARPDKQMRWEDAMGWASKKGGALPTRREMSLIHAHCRVHVDRNWHWSSDSYEDAPSHAWACYFGTGNQDQSHKHGKLRAVAVRHIPIGGRDE